MKAMHGTYLKYDQGRTPMGYPSALFVLLISMILYSCHAKKEEKEALMPSQVYYTCNMHPQIKEDHPGNCPICGMKLIAVPKSSMNMSQEIHLDPRQEYLGDVQLDTIASGKVGDKMVLTGMLNFDLDELSAVNANIEGRVEKLYVKDVGAYVSKGQVLYDLYSEQLNNEKTEYLTALSQQKSVASSLINYSALVQAAKNKLLLWGMTEKQVHDLAQSRQVPILTTFYSTRSGFVTSLGVKEGDYVMEGGNIVQLANLGTLWAEAQVYSSDMSSLDKDGRVTVQIPDLNNLSIQSKINFVNPEINPDTRINLVRASVSNPNGVLHPGMPVYMIMRSRSHKAITLPRDAVLTDGNGSTVWVQTAPHTYRVQMVTTGIQDADRVEIKSGLVAGDVVVTRGAYLINSEYIFENGNNPMAGMDMGSMK